MFTFPPYPPKDYALKRVPKLQTDSAQFTPDSEPRVTQTTLGVFCSPIEYQDGESPSPDKIKLEALNPQILDKWANEARAWWVDKPGKDDFYLHNMFKKYNVKSDSYNPAEKHMEKVFNRSYKYELVCIEEGRLQKLRDKCEREQSTLEHAFKTVERREREASNPPMKVLDCKAQPPFWWKKNLQTDQYTSYDPEDFMQKSERDTPAKPATGRWAKEPCLTAVTFDDPCRRKNNMHSVGQPFKSEACNFYYTHYPPPVLKFHAKKLT